MIPFPDRICIEVFVNRSKSLAIILLAASLLTSRAASQSMAAAELATASTDSHEQHSKSTPSMDHQQMQGINHSGKMKERPRTLVEEVQHHGTSGTSAEPNSTPIPMLMTMKGKWMLMFHGEAFLNSIQQSGARGSDKVFSTDWFMPMAQRQLGPGTLTVRAMLSLEPATVSHRYYPELFQQGETAYGKPIVDGQHPHDFVMELAALYDIKLGDNALLSFYGAPVGDPAIGPTAFPHRASASENPIAPLGHHLEDSTHIAADVLTAGLIYKFARIEASGFHGREPDEFRWDIDSGKIDSWSLRGTVNPAQNWSAQYSFAHLTSAEALHPGEDLQRNTASLMYNHPLARGNWASTLLWGRNRSLPTKLVWNGYLAESTVRFAERNYVWGRVENVDRTNELLLRHQFEPANFAENIIGRVQAYTAGYARDVDVLAHLATGLGVQFTVYSTPESLKLQYGSHPVAGVIFLRIRPFGKER